MKPTKQELRMALRLAVKIVVKADNVTDCASDCPLYMNCSVAGSFERTPERRCTNEVYNYFLAAARKKIKTGK